MIIAYCETAFFHMADFAALQRDKFPHCGMPFSHMAEFAALQRDQIPHGGIWLSMGEIQLPAEPSQRR